MKKLYKTALVIMLTVLTGCGNANAFEHEVKKGNYQKAIEIYQEKLEGNSAAENSSAEFLDTYMQEKLDAYASGKISEKDFTNAYTTVQKINETLHVVNNLPEVNKLGKEIKNSKDSYAEAKTFEEKGSSLEAAEAYRKVSETDTEHYETASGKADDLLDQYVGELRGEVENLMSEKQFDQAAALLEAGIRQIGEKAELIRMRQEIQTRKYEMMLTEADTEGDKAAVISLYAQAEANEDAVISAQMTRMYASAASTFKDDVQKAAQKAFEDGKDYAAAAEIVRNAMNGVKEDEAVSAELQEMMDHYTSYKPVRLQDLGYTSKAKYVDQGTRRSDFAKDVTGRKFDSTGVICPVGGSLNSEYAKEDKEAQITYYLNGEYSELSGTVFRPYCTLAHTEESEVSTRAEIYGDGILLYEAPVMTSNTYESYDFSVDVTGVRQLTFLVRGMWKDPAEWLGMFDYTPRVCLGDLTLQK